MAQCSNDLVRLLILSFSLALYCLLGAAIFHLLENEDEESLMCHLNNVRKYMMNNYNMTGKDFDWFVKKVQHALYHRCHTESTQWCKTRWTFYGAFYFTTTIVSTIGYGHLAPRTLYGRVFFVMFALVGIPLHLMLLKQVGDRILEIIHSVITYFDRRRYSDARLGNVRIKTLVVCLILLVVVIMIGGVSYKLSESWNFFDAVYYCFQAISTVGFGDFIPNDGREPTGIWEIFMTVVHFILLFVGLAVLFTVSSSIAAASDELRITFPNLFGNKTVEEILIETEIQRYGTQEVFRRRSVALMSAELLASIDRTRDRQVSHGANMSPTRHALFKISPYGSPKLVTRDDSSHQGDTD